MVDRLGGDSEVGEETENINFEIRAKNNSKFHSIKKAMPFIKKNISFPEKWIIGHTYLHVADDTQDPGGKLEPRSSNSSVSGSFSPGDFKMR